MTSMTTVQRQMPTYWTTVHDVDGSIFSEERVRLLRSEFKAMRDGMLSVATSHDWPVGFTAETEDDGTQVQTYVIQFDNGNAVAIVERCPAPVTTEWETTLDSLALVVGENGRLYSGGEQVIPFVISCYSCQMTAWVTSDTMVVEKGNPDSGIYCRSCAGLKED